QSKTSSSLVVVLEETLLQRRGYSPETGRQCLGRSGAWLFHRDLGSSCTELPEEHPGESLVESEEHHQPSQTLMSTLSHLNCCSPLACIVSSNINKSTKLNRHDPIWKIYIYMNMYLYIFEMHFKHTAVHGVIH
ncbi:hypothetical protein MHYP_G00270010, partial [Metynnis hypsauchen]